jgi:hypothetical protein
LPSAFGRSVAALGTRPEHATSCGRREDSTAFEEIGDLSLKALSQAIAVYNVQHGDVQVCFRRFGVVVACPSDGPLTAAKAVFPRGRQGLLFIPLSGHHGRVRAMAKAGWQTVFVQESMGAAAGEIRSRRSPSPPTLLRAARG